MSVSEEDIKKALSTVEEPDLKQDLVTLNMVKDITVSGNDVRFTVILTTPACPLKELIRERCVKAIHDQVHADLVVTVDMDAHVTSTRSQAPVLPGVKNIIAVASGKGGVGKSTVSCNLAFALAETGARVGLIDADIYGPSVPTMFGVENARPGVAKINGKETLIPIEQFGVKLLSMGLLVQPDDAIVWRGPMATQALRQFIGDTDWGELDYLLVDLPPGTSDIHLTLVQTVPVTGAVIVTTPQKVAIADALKAFTMFRKKEIGVPILGLVENMAWFEPEEFPGHRYHIFGEGGGKQMADRYEVPLLGQVPLIQGIREAGDHGRPAVATVGPTAEAFAGLAESFAQQVAIRNANKAKTAVVEVSR